MANACIGWRTDHRSSTEGPPDYPSGLALSLVVLFVVPVILAPGTCAGSGRSCQRSLLLD